MIVINWQGIVIVPTFELVLFGGAVLYIIGTVISAIAKGRSLADEEK